jgi:hypothetical protein
LSKYDEVEKWSIYGKVDSTVIAPALGVNGISRGDVHNQKNITMIEHWSMILFIS